MDASRPSTPSVADDTVDAVLTELMSLQPTQPQPSPLSRLGQPMTASADFAVQHQPSHVHAVAAMQQPPQQPARTEPQALPASQALQQAVSAVQMGFLHSHPASQADLDHEQSVMNALYEEDAQQQQQQQDWRASAGMLAPSRAFSGALPAFGSRQPSWQGFPGAFARASDASARASGPYRGSANWSQALLPSFTLPQGLAGSRELHSARTWSMRPAGAARSAGMRNSDVACGPFAREDLVRQAAMRS